MTLNVCVTTDVALCRALRRTVFIEEQGVPEADEIDGLDGEAVHLLATVDGVAVGSARLLRRGDTGKIGRVCVLMEYRRQGIGAALMRVSMDRFRGVAGLRQAKLGSQVHAIPFYEGLGFVAEGPVYDDAGIPHLDMTAPL